MINLQEKKTITLMKIRNSFYLSLQLALFAMMMIATATPASAQGKGDYFYFGGMVNSITRKGIYPGKAELLTPDSLVVDSFITSKNVHVDTFEGGWILHVNKTNGPMIIRLSAESYETLYIDVPSTTISGRNLGKKFYEAQLKPRPKDVKLKGATVKATRVKFYHKGDTLVYNADAFKLAEGSMLDALIRQLPGAQLDDDGVITVNGKRIESLLLNGEEFFKGNNSIMLDNLPAYMVKDVKVYDKQSRLAEFVGHKLGPGEYVMDVNLKKQYSIGWIGNAEAGKGTDDRYLARLFALRFTPQSRVSLYGMANNTNENRKPGEKGTWDPTKMSGSLLATKKGGVDYMVNDREKRFYLNGNAEVSHTSNDAKTRTASQNFLESGDTYNRTFSFGTSSNTSVSTSHDLSFIPNTKLRFNLTPSFSYNKRNNRNFVADGTFDTDPDKIFGKALLDSLQSNMAGTIMRKIAINRSYFNMRGNGYDLSAGTGLNITFRPTMMDFINMNANISTRNADGESFGHYVLDFLRAGNLRYKNQYVHDSPQRNLNVSAGIDYGAFFPGNICIRPSYQFNYSRQRRGKGLYRLDRLPGWGREDSVRLGDLPSHEEYMQAIDAGNSYDRTGNNYEHTAGLKYTREYGILQKGIWTIMDFALNLSFIRKNLDYRRAEIDSTLARNYVFFNPKLYIRHMWNNQKNHIWATYEVTHATPDLAMFIPYTDTSDLFNIYMGGRNIKPSTTHTLKTSFEKSNTERQTNFSAYASYNVTSNRTAWGYVYDKTEGAKTWTPCNVNGNYDIYGNITYSQPLDRARKIMLNTYTSASFYHNVDMISDGSTPAPVRSTVKTLNLHENIAVNYNLPHAKVGLTGGITWNNTSSRRKGFTAINAEDFNYGATLTWDLPADFQIATDLTVYSRRGYGSSSMNTDDIVWNGTLSRRFFKNAITLQITGFDILGQLSNVTRTINAQGRYEAWHNTITQYGMLRLIYRLNIKPKKAPGDVG